MSTPYTAITTIEELEQFGVPAPPARDKILGELQDAVVEVHPRELAVEVEPGVLEVDDLAGRARLRHDGAGGDGVGVSPTCGASSISSSLTDSTVERRRSRRNSRAGS